MFFFWRSATCDQHPSRRSLLTWHYSWYRTTSINSFLKSPTTKKCGWKTKNFGCKDWRRRRRHHIVWRDKVDTGGRSVGGCNEISNTRQFGMNRSIIFRCPKKKRLGKATVNFPAASPWLVGCLSRGEERTGRQSSLKEGGCHRSMLQNFPSGFVRERISANIPFRMPNVG